MGRGTSLKLGHRATKIPRLEVEVPLLVDVLYVLRTIQLRFVKVVVDMLHASPSHGLLRNACSFCIMR